MTVHSQYQEHVVDGLLDHIQDILNDQARLKDLLNKAYYIIASPGRFETLTKSERLWGIEIQRELQQ